MRSLARVPLVLACATVVLALALAVARDLVAGPRTAGVVKPGRGSSPVTGEPPGLEIRLSDAVGGPRERPEQPPPAVAPLTDAEVENLLARLPPLQERPDDRQASALRPKSAPPPRSGVTRLDPWPPPAAPDAPTPTAPAAEPLRVLRHAPEGNVALAARIAVTFSQPMVAVGSHDAASADVPVVLTPTPEGSWRWAGSQLAIFEGPEAGRLPMATSFDVLVPAGTRSATGGVLAAAHRFTFSTPPPRVERMQPQGPSQPTDPLVLLLFDQRIDADAMAAHVRLLVEDRPVAVTRVRLENADDADAQRLRAFAGGEATQSRVLALRTEAPLPQDTACALVVPAGAPSAEGPLASSSEQRFSFRTHGPLRVESARCGWSDETTCPPDQPWLVRFTNALDPASVSRSSVKVVPAVEDLDVEASGPMLWIRGAFAARATYSVTLDPMLRDEFDQELGRAPSLSFRTGAVRPELWTPASSFVVLDPGAPPTLRVVSAGLGALQARLYRVDPERDWARFNEALQGRWQRRDQRFAWAEDAAWSGRIPVEGETSARAETLLDLSPGLRAGLGHVVIVVEPGEPSAELAQTQLVVWAQSTRLGLSAFADSERLLAWATDLGTGAPAPGVTLTLGPGALATATSGGDGLASIPLPPAAPGASTPASGGALRVDERERVARGNRHLVARRGDDVAFLPEQPMGWSQGTGWAWQDRVPVVAWHVFDDRGLYRPGETARIKGFVRTLLHATPGDIRIPELPGPVAWTLRDATFNEVARGTVPLSALGGFDIRLDLPSEMNLGSALLTLGAGTPPGPVREHHHQLRVEEFRRPEYEVTVSAGEGPFLVGGAAEVTATAVYFAGGPLPDAPVQWQVTSRPGEFRPPGWDEFTFGEALPWWRSWMPPAAERTQEHAARTDAAGEHALAIELLSCAPPRATTVTCTATVQDVNRQAWSAATTLLVHPSEAWIGLRPKASFVERTAPFVLDAVVTDRDGRLLPGREIRLRAARQLGRWKAGAWQREETDVVEQAVTSGAQPVHVSLQLVRSGSWRVSATIVDDAGRPNETVLLAWVSGDEVIESRALEQQEVEIIPDRKDHSPGDVARILVRAPFAPAHALLTLRRAGMVSERRMDLAETGTVVEIPVLEEWLPGITVQVDLVGGTGRDRATPAFASGSVVLPVTRRTRELAVAVAADEPTLEPGATTTLRLRVTDPQGAPVEGEVAVVVADEAVLALAGYELADPLATFFPDEGPGVSDHHLRQWVQLGGEVARATASGGGAAGGAVVGVSRAKRADAAMPAPMAMAAEADTGAAAAGGPTIALRTDMRALALFEPAMALGPDGTATVTLQVPDSLTRYRVMAVAVSGPRLFGRGESTVTARRPLMVRPSLPRFLNTGDRAELPVVLQNQTPRDLQVDVALRASLATTGGPRGLRVRVPADDRVEVRFPADALQAGIARVQVVAASGDLADAAELSLPVWTPATTEAFATYGTLDRGAVAQPVAVPEDALEGHGELSLTTSSTALFELSDALLALWSYPFECSEQVASRLLGVLALRDAVNAFSKLPPREELEKAIARDVRTLAERQSWNGDVGLWRAGESGRRWPWVAVHASHALLLADAKGYRVPDRGLDKARRLLREIDDRIPGDTPADCRRAIVAQALHVRHVFGDRDPRRAADLLAEVPIDEHGIETLAFLLPTLAASPQARPQADAIVAHLRNRAAEEAGTVTFAQHYGDGDWLVMHSSRRADGIVLRALLEVDPQSDLLPKLVRGLLDHRTRGAWSNTQENAFVLLALDRYFAAHEAAPPDFHATAWLGSLPLAEQQWTGRSTERRVVEVPLAEIPAPRADVVLFKEGTGRLYWRLGMTYAPRSLRLQPSQHGFVVERAYEGVDDPKDAWRDDDGTWHVKAGALVRSRVTMVAPARRTHVALVDPLPAGVEPLNPALAMTPPVEVETPVRPTTWWWGPWFQHQNLRDDRAEAFTSLLPAGAHEYAWVGRATTPGRFVVPPPKAEEMYHPETFGRGASDVVVVE